MKGLGAQTRFAIHAHNRHLVNPVRPSASALRFSVRLVLQQKLRVTMAKGQRQLSSKRSHYRKVLCARRLLPESILKLRVGVTTYQHLERRYTIRIVYIRFAHDPGCEIAVVHASDVGCVVERKSNISRLFRDFRSPSQKLLICVPSAHNPRVGQAANVLTRAGLTAFLHLRRTVQSDHFVQWLTDKLLPRLSPNTPQVLKSLFPTRNTKDTNTRCTSLAEKLDVTCPALSRATSPVIHSASCSVSSNNAKDDNCGELSSLQALQRVVTDVTGAEHSKSMSDDDDDDGFFVETICDDIWTEMAPRCKLLAAPLTIQLPEIEGMDDSLEIGCGKIDYEDVAVPEIYDDSTSLRVHVRCYLGMETRDMCLPLTPLTPPNLDGDHMVTLDSSLLDDQNDSSIDDHATDDASAAISLSTPFSFQFSDAADVEYSSTVAIMNDHTDSHVDDSEPEASILADAQREDDEFRQLYDLHRSSFDHFVQRMTTCRPVIAVF